MFHTIGIVGLGLIGGSFAKAMKKTGRYRILGLDRKEETVRAALDAGAIDEAGGPKDLQKADLVIVALHPEATVQFAAAHMKELQPGTVLLDTCGIKRYLVASLGAAAKECGVIYIGGHPMAGREYSGFAYSLAELYQDASMILTPCEASTADAVQAVAELCRQIGFSKVVQTTPEHHDAMIAFTSQLAHVVSSAYIKSPEASRHDGYSAGSYKDLTRVARLDENMWTELFLHNKAPLTAEIDEIIRHLQEYRDAIAGEDAQTLRQLLADGRKRKEAIDKAAD